MKRDVVVVGGGPAGAVAALVLARAGRAVTVLAAARDRSARAGETLPAAALPVLRDLGVLEAFYAQRHLPCAGNVSAWGSPLPHVTDAIANPLGNGWQIARAAFDDLLLQEAARAGTIVVRAALRDVRCSDGEWCVAHDGGGLCARWLIDATGRRRAVARRCNASVHRLDRLIACHVLLACDCAEDLDTRTLIEAVPDGWWYTSRVPALGRMVAFLTDDTHTARSTMRADVLRRRLDDTVHVGALLSRYDWNGVRVRGADASSTRLACATGDNWLAVGDAAIAFDPLSSQGVFNALCTGIEGGAAVAAALAGDVGPLADYNARIAAVSSAYVQQRARYYSTEQRWTTQPFWRRRHESGMPTEAVNS